MNLSDRIKALPAIKDEAGSECVSREVVLGLVAGDGVDLKPLLDALQLRDLHNQLGILLADEDLDADKLEDAAESLLPKLFDAMIPIVR